MIEVIRDELPLVIKPVSCEPSSRSRATRPDHRSHIISPQIEKLSLPGVRNTVAVASGKGGVGKSTVTVNLAVALAQRGLAVGILDADIYGPSQGTLLGIPADSRPEVKDDQMQPITAHGVRCMSMSFVTSSRTPAVWRGPMASSALQQLLTQTHWGELDFLLVDMPPGTGDIQLTLAQRVPLAGAVIVTTPQDVALLDARKGIEMFRKVAVPIIGIVENMSVYRCSVCGHEDEIFGTGGGAAVAKEYDTQVIARLPLTLETRQQSDAGYPVLLANPDCETSRAFVAAAEAVVAGAVPVQAPTINILDD